VGELVEADIAFHTHILTYSRIHFLTMLSVAEALEAVRRECRPLPSRRVRLSDLLGLHLSEDVTSRVDSPPFDKAMVDGFAIATTDPAPVLRITEMVTAGAVPSRAVEPGTTIRVMTGAPVPDGADAVVKWEDCELLDETNVYNPAAASALAPGSCVLKRGVAFNVGEVVLAAGKRLGPLDIALLAEIGQAEVSAGARPVVGVLPTGDELVEVDQPLGPGQIRNSNGPMLLATVAAAGATAVDLGVARDTPADLRDKISRGLECDVLLVSGGVSAGVKDLVPRVLAELGVSEKFHQVRVKPGKPLWFGVKVWHALRSAEGRGRAAGSAATPLADSGRATQTLVFGLPGNPVSTLVSFKLFVEPALAALAGAPFAAPATQYGVLAARFKHRGGRPTFFPCRFVHDKDRVGAPAIEPLDWRGSADLATLTRADCLAAFPGGDYELGAGDPVEWIAL
jgi:molybdopterin molybdotransferase